MASFLNALVVALIATLLFAVIAGVIVNAYARTLRLLEACTKICQRDFYQANAVRDTISSGWTLFGFAVLAFAFITFFIILFGT